MKKIDLIPKVDASNFSDGVDYDFEQCGIGTHDEYQIVSIDWWDLFDKPAFQNWLLDEYGEEIKKYDSIVIIPT